MDKDRLLKAMVEVYDVCVAQSESFYDDHIGPDLAYLLGAMLKGRYCEWSSQQPIVRLLHDFLDRQHLVWSYILEEE